ncbi:thiamine pyrophosphate-binding protein [Actinomadura rugatobispora]|uniref:Thiamine pyrophosphate-binding protein n=1 Tax=Actinomadura rugatobispora TaxID=1994 RepID=A0ABW0ZY54_9ACTN|nr:thiamine pyrophosphate-binding protein [Actinomadura rugatobispora]
MTIKGHHCVARALRDHGVDTVFGLLGDANMLHVHDYTEHEGGTFVSAVDERGAVSMADGYARIRGTAGVVTVTHGPATTNTITALVEAVRADSPILLITGDPVSKRYFPQEIDLEGLARLSGADYWRVRTPEHLVDDLAMVLAKVELTRRPLVLNIPFDFQFADLEYARSPFRPVEPQVTGPDEAALDRALGVLASARRPVVVAGRGAVLADAGKELVGLADALGAPLASTAGAKDLFSGHPYDIGIIGTVARPKALDVINSSDCLIVFGAGLNDHTTVGGALLRDKAIVRCDLRPEKLLRATPADAVVLGDAKAIATEMLDRLREAELEPGTWRISALGPAGMPGVPVSEDFTDRSGPGGIDPRTAMIRLDEILPRPRQVVTDVGRFVTAPWRYLHADAGTRFFQTGGNWSSIGLGVAAAIGAASAAPDHLTVAVVGDGGGMMGIVEFSTAVRNRIPFLLVVVNDRCYGAEYPKLINHGVDPDYASLGWPSLAGVARSLGGAGHTVRTPAELDAAVAAIRHPLDTPTLIELEVDRRIEPSES